MSISTATRVDSSLQGPTLASILGVKGPLRFRPHGSSQKPHVVLRRVQLSDESSDEEESSTVVYFSLFASKRIEVKPGKEILLAVANADGTFDSQPILLAGDLSQGKEQDDKEDMPALTEVIPPKMRRGWKARTDEDTKPPAPEEVVPPPVPAVAHSSIGVQVEPAYNTSFTQTEYASATAGVQVQPIFRSATVQAQPSALETAVQSDPVPYTSSTTQTIETRSYVTTDAQTDPLPSRPSANAPVVRERSLSPMELDSPPTSRQRSSSPVVPVHASIVHPSEPRPIPQPKGDVTSTPPLTMSPSQTDSSQPSTIFSPHLRPHSPTRSLASISRASSIASSVGAPDMQLPSSELKSVSTSTPNVKAVPFRKPSLPRSLPMEMAGISDSSSSRSIDSTPHSSPPPITMTPPVKDGLPSKHRSNTASGVSTIPASRPSQGKYPLCRNRCVSKWIAIDSESIVKVEEHADRSLLRSPLRKRKRSLDPAIGPSSPSPNASPSGRDALGAKGVLPPTSPRCRPPASLKPTHVQSTSPSPPPSASTTLTITPTRPLSQRPISDLPKLSNFFVRASKPSAPEPVSSETPAPAPPDTKPIATNSTPESTKPNLVSAPAPPAHPRVLVKSTNAATNFPPGSSPAPSNASYSSINKVIPSQPRLPPTQPQAMAIRLRNGMGPLDSRSFMHIPTGPMSNPLGIRPSTRPIVASTNGQINKAPPTAPKMIAKHSTLAAPKMPGSLKALAQNGPQASALPSTSGSGSLAQRKKLLVGNGWPPVRNVGGSTSNEGTSSSDTSVPALSLSPTEEVMYGPPPPPPTPPAPTPPHNEPPALPPVSTSKWKPVNGDKPLPASSSTISPASQPDPLKPAPQAHKASSTLSDLRADTSPTTSSAPPKTFPLSHQKSLAERISGVGSTSKTETPRPLALRLKAPVSSPTSPTIPSVPETPSAGVQSLPPAIPAITPHIDTLAKSPTMKSPVVNGAAKTPVIPSPSPKLSHPSVPLPLNHPLPPKPVGVGNTPSRPPRGTKRELESPEIELHKKRRRVFRWPSIEPLRSMKLKGDGDLGIKKIAFNSNGSQFALCCSDRTVRIWSNETHNELARLTHNSPVVSVLWLTGDTGVVTLSEDGVVSKWIKTGPNYWQWAKILDASDRRTDDDPICLAYRGDRIAVAFPRQGVKVWIWAKGTWQPQRSIVRQNVTAIQFVEDGEALLGGTKDGVLWYCEIPNGTLRACTFLRSKITQIDLGIGGTQALVGHASGSCHLVCQSTGKVEQLYSLKDIDHRTEFGALFAAKDQAVLFGDVDGCLPVWDKKKATVVYGLDHGDDALIQAATSFDNSSSKNIAPCIITGTKQGQLCWWSQPASGSSSSQNASDEPARKRQSGAAS